jgi:hypothetical protein
MSDAREKPAKVPVRTSPGSRLSSASSTNLHTAAAQLLPVCDLESASATTPPLQLGAIKELVRAFVHARRDTSKKQLGTELSELYCILSIQAQLIGVDTGHALAQLRAGAAKRRPRLVP